MAVGSRHAIVPSRLAPGVLLGHRAGPAHGPRARRWARYVALTKPRIIELLLVTTVPTMILAEQGLPVARSDRWPRWWAARLAAGGANAINMYVDRDIDRLMPRTQHRPLVTGIVSPGAALAFAVVLEVVAFVELWALVNLLSALPGAVGHALLRLRVHALAEADLHPEHRDRRRRRGRAGARRLGGGHRTA